MMESKELIDIPKEDIKGISLITTNVVKQEIEAGLRNNKKGGIYGLEQYWKILERNFQFVKIELDPAVPKDRGERSLIQYGGKNLKKNFSLISANKEDILKYIRKENVKNIEYETPFEFFEEMEKLWFKNYKDTIKFMIVINSYFSVVNSNNLGNKILKKF